MIPAVNFIAYIPLTLNFFQDTINLDSLQTAPLYEPAAVQFSFQTPGWYFLFILIILLVAFLIVRWMRNYIRDTYRREALKNLTAIRNHFREQNDISCVNDAFLLLKFVALETYGREKVAAVYGNDWLNFLEETGNNTPFGKYSDSISAILYYSSEVKKEQVEQLFDLTKKWIRTHA